ncbi:hypothetical protein D8M34_05905 [Microbacterium sp. HSID17254]|uniref:hypothetical protein n=1 Tax=Microbacterium sp. HSID17254 TaxID=2419509 RepID=UPI000F87E302|nr:hypothetical protein [Microbacterium sp. HSID17254]RUQ07003.1 hypothetical protein D8M34_05905 [Microbacterium sp. HSID17254]
MTDDTWTDDDDARYQMAALPPNHPVNLARVFFHGVRDESLDRSILDRMVTPESKDAWGDFSATRETMRSIEGPAIGSLANTALGADDVVYVKILSGVGEGYTTNTMADVEAMVFTFVWRPEADLWQIHQFGELVHPENLPRTSPGSAPAV